VALSFVRKAKEHSRIHWCLIRQGFDPLGEDQ